MRQDKQVIYEVTYLRAPCIKSIILDELLDSSGVEFIQIMLFLEIEMHKMLVDRSEEDSILDILRVWSHASVAVKLNCKLKGLKCDEAVTLVVRAPGIFGEVWAPADHSHHTQFVAEHVYDFGVDTLDIRGN